MTDTCAWKIVAIEDEAPEVKTLVLEAQGERPSFIAGQYLTVRLPNFEPVEGKAYSIASSPNEITVRLTIKEMGAFSKAILAHKVGDTLNTSLPYGFFYPDPDEVLDLAFVVGGVGITPCISIIETLAQQNFSKNIFLFYSNKTTADIIFKKKLDALTVSFSRLIVQYYLTEETPASPTMHEGRITASPLLGALPTKFETDFFICGSIDFTKSMWKTLRDAGISSSQIYTEGFF